MLITLELLLGQPSVHPLMHQFENNIQILRVSHFLQNSVKDELFLMILGYKTVFFFKKMTNTFTRLLLLGFERWRYHLKFYEHGAKQLDQYEE